MIKLQSILQPPASPNSVKYLSFSLFSLFVFLLVQSCGGRAQASPAGEDVVATAPSPRQTIRSAMRASVWRFVYCLEEGTDDAGLVDFLHEMANKQPFGKRIEVVSCAEISTDSLGAGPVTLFGNRLPAGAERLPIGKNGPGWRLSPDKTFMAEDVLLLPYYRNPWSESATVAGFFVSDDIAELVNRLKAEYGSTPDRMFWPNWAYELHRANGDLIYGSFADTSWSFDSEAELSLKAPNKPVSEDGGIQIFAYDGDVAPEEVTKVRSSLELIRLLSNVVLDEENDFYPEVRLYPNLERIGLRTGNMDPVQYNQEEEVLHLVPSFVSAEDLRLSLVVWRPFIGEYAKADNWKQVVVLMQQESGPRLNGYAAQMTEARRLQQAGLAQMKTQEDPSRFLEEARMRLAAAKLAVDSGKSITDRLESVAGGASLSSLAPLNPSTAPARMRPNEERNSGGATSVTETSGPEEAMPELGAAPSVTETSGPEEAMPELGTAPPNRVAPPKQVLAGMTFAHEGYRIHNGYGGEKIKPSLDSLGKLSVNALAIVPYTFMRDPNKPTTLFIPDNAGSENDWATMYSAREANQRGWFTLLKPQIWLGGGHWPGDVDFDTEAKWDTFFNNYTYWIMHYAVLAEREQIGGLCLGTELVKTTLKHPERWKEIIAKVRQVYGGQLTYAANWGEEFEGFTFWEDLDAIGLNSYYPLSEKDAPTDEELLAGARSWMRMAAEVSRRTNRPLWLTEVGFRSVDQAWVNPHADGGDRNASGTAQARCFEALTTAASETPELKGMFIWKWPSYLGRENWRGGGKEFSPGGKPAAAVIGNFNYSWTGR